MSVGFDEDGTAWSRSAVAYHLPHCPVGKTASATVECTCSEAAASADAMEVWTLASDAYENGDHKPDAEAAARIIQQYGDQREAAGYRRGVEAAAEVAEECFSTAYPDKNTICEIVANEILALLDKEPG